MLNDYLPEYLKDVEEFKTLTDAEQPEFEDITALINNASNDFSVFTLKEHGVKRWESILGIAGKAADGLDARRFRIITHIIGQIPITKRSLYSQLVTLCGEGGFTMQIDGPKYTLNVKVGVAAQSAFNDVKSLITRLAPANIVCNVTQLYNQHSEFTKKTHAQLAAHTHKQIRSEVI